MRSLLIILVHSTTQFSPFEIVYGFNPLTHVHLLPLPNTSLLKHKGGKSKVKFVKKLHEQVKIQLQKKNESYAKNANKGRKKMVFEPEDWVWVNMRKETFPLQRKSKLQPRGDDPFKVLSKINYNSYRVELLGEYGVNATFNVSHLSSFDVGDDEVDSRLNYIQEGWDDEDMENQYLNDVIKAREVL